MAKKKDDRPVDAGLAAQFGKNEQEAIEFWKHRFGLIAAIFPGAGILALVWFVAAWSIILGAFLIVLALQLRQMAHRLTHAGAV